MTADPFAPLLAALDRRAAEGRPAAFWLRDDDAVEPTPALDRLLALTGGNAVPLLLAVIPRDTGAALAARLGAEPHATVAVHGWAHRNHAPPGEKQEELGAHRPAATVLAELAEGRAKLATLHGRRLAPILVPPWNRIAGGLLPHLPGLGFRALSVFGPEAPGPLPMLNTHVDLIDWRGSRRAFPAEALVAAILARLATMEQGAMGLMTHHLVHDEGAWSFLGELFRRTSGHPGCRWLPVAALLPGQMESSTPS